MGYRTLWECIADLERTGQLVRIDCPVDATLEIAEIQRRVFRAGGPALLFTQVKRCRFPMVSNLFGTMDRVRYIFRDSIDSLKELVELQDPSDMLSKPRVLLKNSWNALNARPSKVKTGPILKHQTTIDQLPQLKSWPDDGGAYITLPQVYTEDPDDPGLQHSNLGMYRVQLSGGEYVTNDEVGMHYQIHRGIAAHHAAAIRRDEPLRVNIFIGGPPSMMMAAVMPLPEGMSELAFAGLLNRRRVPMICHEGLLPIHAEADFCITGYLDPSVQKQEGPFGDHLGYYSLAHDFPVMRVEHVFHREGAVWPFTVVGRPPQEDSNFGKFIHEITEPVIPKKIPGIKAVHAVDAAGVHPLLLAVGSERYVPYDERRPRELLTLANALLGQGQLSLAKFLMIVAGEDYPELDIQHVPDFFRHLLERVDWRRDLHFQTRTTMDTLDYSGTGLNEGSKVVIAAAGPPIRKLPVTVHTKIRLPEGLGFEKPHAFWPGITVIEGPAYDTDGHGKDIMIERFCANYHRDDYINRCPLLIIVDDSEFASQNQENFLWTTFTRADPASDIYGIDHFTCDKHWGCHGSLVIDARTKPHHAPPLEESDIVNKRIDTLIENEAALQGLL